MLFINCAPFRDKAIKHMDSLIKKMEEHPRKDFVEKMSSVFNDIQSLKNKLSEKAESIDEVILLLDYIEVIKRPENKVDELSHNITLLKERMVFLN